MAFMGMIAGLVLAQPLGSDPMKTFRGQPVLSVDFDAPREENVEDLAGLVGIEHGYLLDIEDVQAAIKRLYALGRFAFVGVQAEQVSGTVALHIQLRPIKHLDELEIEGDQLFDPDALLEGLKLSSGDEVDSRTPHLLRREALAYLKRAGFPLARVEVDESYDGFELASYALTVQEGPPSFVSEIRFRGHPRISNAILRRHVRTTPGTILSLPRLQEDRARLIAAYVDKGFLGVRVGEPRIDEDGQRTVVTFPIEAGERAAIVFRGNLALSAEALMEQYPARGRPLAPGDFQGFAERVEQLYRRLGFSGVRARVRRYRHPSLARAGLYVMEIHEGQPLTVTKLEFDGAQAFESELLAAQIRARLLEELGAGETFEPISSAELATHWSEGTGTGKVRIRLPPEQRYVPELYEQALEEIRAAYRHQGYLAATVGPMEAKIHGSTMSIRVPVDEGPQTLVRSLAFRHSDAFTAEELLAALEAEDEDGDGDGPVQLGAPYSKVGFEDGRIELTRRYRDRGYLYCRVYATREFSKDGRFADLAYRFEEGPQVRLDNVLVRGNRYTRESIIRSYMALEAGDVYSLEQALKDQRSINSLGVFSQARVRLIDEERPAEHKDLVAEVLERDRQPIEVVPGMSTADGPRLRLSYAHINLLGTASTFSSSITLNHKLFFGQYGDPALESKMKQRYKRLEPLQRFEGEVRAGLRSPRLLSLPMDPTARLDFVLEREIAIPYSLLSATIIFGLDLFATDRLKLSIEPQVALTDLRCFGVEDDPSSDSPDSSDGPDSPDSPDSSEIGCFSQVGQSRRIRRGLLRTFKVGPAVTWDRRDNPFNPTRGFYTTARAIYAVGGSQPREPDDPFGLVEAPGKNWQRFSFAKVEAKVTGYVPLLGSVLALSARAGVIHLLEGVGVPVDDRFFLGGRASLRGFVEGNLIAQDACVLTKEETKPSNCAQRIDQESAIVSTGGNNYLLLKSELRLPLFESVSLGLFVDVGNLWVEMPGKNDFVLRSAIGGGLRYGTPVGPVAFDVGFNLEPLLRKGESGREFHFSIGVF